MQESEVQAEYDHVLREAKLLRLDFQHALTNCVEHKVGEFNLAPALRDCPTRRRSASVLKLTAHVCRLQHGPLVLPKVTCMLLLARCVGFLAGLLVANQNACCTCSANQPLGLHYCRSRLNRSTQS